MLAGSYTHFALLTSDQTWRLYHTERLSDPEQIFELAPRWCAATRLDKLSMLHV